MMNNMISGYSGYQLGSNWSEWLPQANWNSHLGPDAPPSVLL